MCCLSGQAYGRTITICHKGWGWSVLDHTVHLLLNFPRWCFNGGIGTRDLKWGSFGLLQKRHGNLPNSIENAVRPILPLTFNDAHPRPPHFLVQVFGTSF
ncbi:hypothetical protein SLA2020_435120 [Shorea laevis]